MAYISLKNRFAIPDYVNPEELTTGILEFSADKCIRCRLCTTMCPARSIILDKVPKNEPKPLPRLNEIKNGVTACIACGCCCAACPENAIDVKRGFSPGKFYTRLHQHKELSFPVKY